MTALNQPPAPLVPGRRGASRFSPAGGHGPSWLRPARLGLPLFWIILGAFILLPCAAFLLLAVSPRVFDQGPQWFTLTYLRQSLTGSTLTAVVNSLWVSCAAAVIGLGLGFPVAWLAARTTMPGRRWVSGGMWLALLLPSWLPALGWERLVQPGGVMYRIGLDWPGVTHLVMGPFGVTLLLGLRCVPFSYLAVSAALAGLGQEFEDAARVHGATRLAALRLIVPILAPALLSALAIGFAESISDFGVAATLAYNSNFTLATYALYAAIGNFPPSFPLAAGMSWLLVAAVAIPLALQARALRGRSYATLSGRTRQAVRRRLNRIEAVAAGTGVLLFFLVILGIPGFGAVSGSLLGDLGGSFSLTFTNYAQLFQQPDLIGPLQRSMVYAVITATVTVFLGFVAARLLSRRRTAATGAMDFLLLASVALPGVVFGAGYIFAYNLPFMSALHVNLYQTVQLLVIAYIASSLPTSARVLVGPASRLQASLPDAARAHGAGVVAAWTRGVLPVVSRPILMAWLYTFCGVFLELPLSQLLYAPGSPPAAIAIEDNLSNYHFGVGMAQAVLAVFIAFAVVGLALGAYRLLAPAVAAHLEGPSVAEPISVAALTKTYPGAATAALRSVSLDVAPGTFLVLLGPSGSGKTTLLRCLAGIERIDSGVLSIGSRVVADGRAHVPPEQRDLSMVFQDYALWPHLTALDNVAFALRRRRLPRPECRARAALLLARVGLDGFAGRYPNELSGGQQQRVALARALIADTGLILCDEPLSNLDADLRERMRVEISALVREAGATTVYITHDQAEAFALADVIGVLEEGELVQYGTPEEIYHHPATPFVARFTGLAGELAVRVAGRDGDGTLDITTVAGGTGRLPAVRPGVTGPGLRPGDEALLAIRSTGVHLAAATSGERHLTGKVADVAFRGRGYEHAIDLPGLGRLTGVFAPDRAERGAEVGLRLDPDGCHVFPAAAAEPAGSARDLERSVPLTVSS